MVWFRKLFIVFSRYTYVNSFTRYIQEGREDRITNEANAEGDIDESGDKKAKIE